MPLTPLPEPAIDLPDPLFVSEGLGVRSPSGTPTWRSEPRTRGRTSSGFDQIDLGQQLSDAPVLEVLHRGHVDGHPHPAGQVPDDPHSAGVHRVGDHQSAMSLVELLRQLRLKPLPESRLQRF